MKNATIDKLVLDDIDQVILQELIDNPRATYTAIANRINTSRQTVRTRIQAMEDVGLIKEYAVIIDWDMVGDCGL